MTQLELLERLERCFEPGEIETLVWRSDGGPVGRFDAAVKVVHHESGIEVVADEGASQVENKAAALIELMRQLHARASSETGGSSHQG